MERATRGGPWLVTDGTLTSAQKERGRFCDDHHRSVASRPESLSCSLILVVLPVRPVRQPAADPVQVAAGLCDLLRIPSLPPDQTVAALVDGNDRHGVHCPP